MKYLLTLAFCFTFLFGHSQEDSTEVSILYLPTFGASESANFLLEGKSFSGGGLIFGSGEVKGLLKYNFINSKAREINVATSGTISDAILSRQPYKGTAVRLHIFTPGIIWDVHQKFFIHSGVSFAFGTNRYAQYGNQYYEQNINPGLNERLGVFAGVGFRFGLLRLLTGYEQILGSLSAGIALKF